MFDKKEAGDGALTSFQSVYRAGENRWNCTIAGVAELSLAPGRFLMWLSALLGMCTFAEVTLAVHFRERTT